MGIETSCDDTGVALVEDGRLLDTILASQTDIHAIFGGVVPELASREHYRWLPTLFDHLVARNNLGVQDLQAIAVARGPGLLGSLLVGAAFAKGLALSSGARLVGVNHLYAHLLACQLDQKFEWPCLGLVVSGGHTRLYLMRSPLDFELLGRSLDDAAGETFDKVGKLLGMAYPAGRTIDERAKKGKQEYPLPEVLLGNDSLDFSFSGLKAAAIRLINMVGVGGKASDETCRQQVDDICLSLNMTIANILAHKLSRALKLHTGIKTVLLAGGVAANTIVRKAISETARSHNMDFAVPPVQFCQDNGAMIAYAGYLAVKEGLGHNLDMRVIPRGQPVPQDLEKFY